MKIGAYTTSLYGHRDSYLRFVLNNFSSKRIEFKELFITKSPLLFLMVEDSFLLYFVVCIWRSLFGRVTAGLLFRPLPVIECPSLRLKIKKIALMVLKKKLNVKTILIVPDSTNPEFSCISDGWIYDFQFWDLNDSDYKKFSDIKSGKALEPLSNAIKKRRNNRNVLSALGSQDRIKGFNVFVNAYIYDKEIQKKFIFAYGGKVKGYDDLVDKFGNAGGFAENRYVSDDEMLALYASSELIWTLYAEDYDQASGIFGRAVQFGIPVIVRRESLLHKICELENIPHFAMTKDCTTELSNIDLQVVDVEQGRQFRDRFREKSIKQLSTILGIELIEISDGR